MAVDTFRRYIWLLETLDRLEYAEFETIQSEIIDGKVVVKDDIINVLDDGRSWSEGYLRHKKLSHLVICDAVQDICDHKSYSIPDLLRMNSFKD